MLAEDDIRTIVESCAGVVAHPDAHRRNARGSDLIFEGAVIELKLLDEDGLEKSERRSKSERTNFFLNYIRVLA